MERYAGADFPDAAIEPPLKARMKAPFRMVFGLAPLGILLSWALFLLATAPRSGARNRAAAT